MVCSSRTLMVNYPNPLTLRSELPSSMGIASDKTEVLPGCLTFPPLVVSLERRFSIPKFLVRWEREEREEREGNSLNLSSFSPHLPHPPTRPSPSQLMISLEYWIGVLVPNDNIRKASSLPLLNFSIILSNILMSALNIKLFLNWRSANRERAATLSQQYLWSGCRHILTR